MTDKYGPIEMKGPGVDAAREIGLIPIQLPHDFVLADFKPCVIYNDPLKLTQMILEDVTIVWHAWRGTASMGHAVDLGYDADGKLVGIQIWDDVRTRPIKNPAK